MSVQRVILFFLWFGWLWALAFQAEAWDLAKRDDVNKGIVLIDYERKLIFLSPEDSQD